MHEPTLDRQIRYSAALHVAANLLILPILILAWVIRDLFHFSILLVLLSTLILIGPIVKRCNHSFIEQSLKKSLDFTLSLIIYGAIPLTLFALLSLIVWCLWFYFAFMFGMSRIGSSAPLDSGVTDILKQISRIAEFLFSISKDIFILLAIVQVGGITIGIIQAVRGRIYKYPFAIKFSK